MLWEVIKIIKTSPIAVGLPAIARVNITILLKSEDKEWPKLLCRKKFIYSDLVLANLNITFLIPLINKSGYLNILISAAAAGLISVFKTKLELNFMALGQIRTINSVSKFFFYFRFCFGHKYYQISDPKQ